MTDQNSRAKAGGTPDSIAQKKFKFSSSNQEKVKEILAKYPQSKKESAVMPLLWLAQKQGKNNWIPKAAMNHIANLLDMPPIKVYEVATFYTMFNKEPVGRHLIQVCRTTPCWLRGSDDITKACKKNLKIEKGETTKDGLFTLIEVECLGACVNAPMVQINDDYYEDLSTDRMLEILEKLKKNQKVGTGSQTGRTCSAPVLDISIANSDKGSGSTKGLKSSRSKTSKPSKSIKKKA